MKSSLPQCHGQQLSSKLIHIVVLTVLCFFTVPISGNTTNLFTWLDCPTPLPSSSPTPPPPSSTNSTFQDNVFALLHALPSAAVPTGFAFLSRGQGTERAFVRGMCRGDSAPDDCAAYLHAVVLDIKGHCDTSRRAAIWCDKCFLSYADTNGSTAYEESFHQEIYNYRSVSDKYTMEFEATYYQLMSRLLARAVNGSSEPVPAFATGHAVFDRDAPTPNGTIYGMVQCMRDLTAADCEECLRNSQELPQCCYAHVGGVVLRYNCYLRMETYAYYDLALDASPVPGPLAPSPSSSVLVTRGKQRRILFL